MHDARQQTLRVALHQASQHKDAQFQIRQATELRLVSLLGKCISTAALVGAGGLYELFHGARPAILLGALTACALLSAAGFVAAGNMRRDCILPGRLPSDLWNSLLKPDMTEAAFVASIMADDQCWIAHSVVIQQRLDAALRWVLALLAVAAPAGITVAVLASLLGASA